MTTLEKSVHWTYPKVHTCQQLHVECLVSCKMQQTDHAILRRKTLLNNIGNVTDIVKIKNLFLE